MTSPSDEGVKAHLRAAARSTAAYGIGAALKNATSLIMLPIYTRFLTPADYGAVALLTAALDLAGILVGLRVSQAFLRFYATETDDSRRRAIAGTAFALVVGASLVGAFVLAAAATPISTALFGVADYDQALRVFAFTLVTLATTTLCYTFLRARQQAWLFLLFSTVQLALQVATNLIFVVGLQLHVMGVVLASLASGALMTVILTILLLRTSGFAFSIAVARHLYAYTLPLIVASLGGFVAFYLDRYLLRIYGDLALVGLYALAYRLTSAVSTLAVQPVHESWNAQRFAIHETTGFPETQRVMFKAFSGIGLVGGIAVAVFGEDLLRVLAAPEFWPAAAVLPLLAATVAVNALAAFCNFGILLANATRHIAFSTWSSTLVRAVLYVVLIPRFGIMGAAVATLIGASTELAWINHWSAKFVPIKLPWSFFGAGLVAAAFAVLLAGAGPSTLGLSIAWHAAIFVGYLIVLAALPIWSHDERRWLLRFLRSPRTAWVALRG